MKVHQFTRGFWEHEPSLTLGCKRLRPLAPKFSNNTDNSTNHTPSLSFDLKSFIKPESTSRIKNLSSSDHHDNNKKDPPSPQSQVHN
jgi:hypothetical protein